MPTVVVKYTIIPCWLVVGFIAGKASILGIIIPSVFDGVIWLLDFISNCALGVVVLIPTWAKVFAEKSIESSEIYFIVLKLVLIKKENDVEL